MSEEIETLTQVVKKQTVQSPECSFAGDDFGEENPFTERTFEDEIELKFDTGQSLFVSRSFLAYCSPVFHRMFQSNFKESKEGTVALKEKDYDAFLEMLLFLHPTLQKPISDEKARAIFAIAHEYQIPTALKQIQDLLVRQIQKTNLDVFFGYGCSNEKTESFVKNILDLLNFVDDYENAALKSAAAERLSILQMSFVTAKSSYKNLSESCKITFLMYRLRRCDTMKIMNEFLD